MLSTYKIETFEDILKALKENPEWLEELRRIILTEELIALPRKFQRFLENDFKPLKLKVDKIDQDVKVLKEDVKVLKEDVEILKKDVKILKEDAAELKGDNFERKVRERAPSYFGRLIRRCRVLSIEDLAEVLEVAVEKGFISEDDKSKALDIDVVVTGILKSDKEQKVVLAAEISQRVDRVDVERAYERSLIIGKALALPALPVVIGKDTTEGAISKAEELNVTLI